MVFQGYFKGVLWKFKGVPRKYKRCSKRVCYSDICIKRIDRRVFWGRFKVFSRWLQRYLKSRKLNGVTRNFPGVIQGSFRGCFKESSRKFKGCFKYFNDVSELPQIYFQYCLKEISRVSQKNLGPTNFFCKHNFWCLNFFEP